MITIGGSKEITSQNINAANLPDGLIPCWIFDVNYKNVTSIGNDGQAIKLDWNSYVEVLSSESLNITDEITLLAHVKWTIELSNGSSHANIVCKSGEYDTIYPTACNIAKIWKVET